MWSIRGSVLPLEVGGAEDQLCALGIEIRKALRIRFAEIVVVTCDQILDLRAVAKRMGDRILRLRDREGHQHDAPSETQRTYPDWPPVFGENLHVYPQRAVL